MNEGTERATVVGTGGRRRTDGGRDGGMEELRDEGKAEVRGRTEIGRTEVGTEGGTEEPREGQTEGRTQGRR